MTPKTFNPIAQNRYDIFMLGLILLVVLIFVSDFTRSSTKFTLDTSSIPSQREIQASPELGH